MRWSVTPHALQRVRDRWPVKAWPSELLNRELYRTINRSKRGGIEVKTPGGTYVPFSLAGLDGYAVFHDNRVVTVMPKDLCPEVNTVIGELFPQCL